MNGTFKKTLGAVIAAHRAGLGISKQRFALMIGVNRLTLRYIEEGSANPTLDTLLKISEGLDTPLSQLITEGEEGRVEI